MLTLLLYECTHNLQGSWVGGEHADVSVFTRGTHTWYSHVVLTRGTYTWYSHVVPTRRTYTFAGVVFEGLVEVINTSASREELPPGVYCDQRVELP